MDYQEYKLINSVINPMLPYVAVNYLLNYGYTFNKRKKRSKDIMKKGNYIILLSPCKKYRCEFELSDEDYAKIYFLI